MTEPADSQNDDAFGAALMRRDFEAAALLLQRGSDINRIFRRTETYDRDVVEESTTHLIDSAVQNQIEAVRFLLEHGADPNITSIYSGRTALLEASRFGHVEVVALLLAHGANVTAVDRYSSKTPLGYATERVDPAVAQSLLEAGAPATFHRFGFSLKGGDEARELVRLLVQHGADINAIDDWGRSPLMWAAQYADPETIDLMIALGAEVNRVSEPNMNGVNQHHTALSLARDSRRDAVAEVLLRHGASGGGRAGSTWTRVRRFFKV